MHADFLQAVGVGVVLWRAREEGTSLVSHTPERGEIKLSSSLEIGDLTILLICIHKHEYSVRIL